jgi:hypothetical protein
MSRWSRAARVARARSPAPSISLEGSRSFCWRESGILSGTESAGSTSRPSEVALEAIGTAVFELGGRHAREHGETPLSALLARIVFICLAPLLGADQVGDFVCRKAPHGHGHALLASAA